MTKSYTLTKPAAADLLEIRNYIAADSLEAARRFVGELTAAMEQLAQFPHMGHRRDDLADERLRVWPVDAYVVVYRPDTSPLQVVRVLSGWRNIGLLI